MIFLLKTFIFTTLVASIWANCDVCQNTNRVACHSRNRYSLCINGRATLDYITCPENFICTSGLLVCYPQDSVISQLPSCDRDDILRYPTDGEVGNLCGVCDAHRTFACLNETTIAFCFGFQDPMKDVVSYCPEGTVCDISRNTGFCSDRNLVEPSCSTVPAPTEPRDPNQICLDAGSTGSYKTDDDTTCTKFILCYTIDGVLYGLEKKCPNGQYFHPEQRICSIDKPDDCSVDSNRAPAEVSLDPNQICQDAGSTGQYKSDHDDTCTEYVLCYFFKNTLNGLLKRCTSGQYFHPDMGLCRPVKPEGCQ